MSTLLFVIFVILALLMGTQIGWFIKFRIDDDERREKVIVDSKERKKREAAKQAAQRFQRMIDNRKKRDDVARTARRKTYLGREGDWIIYRDVEGGGKLWINEKTGESRKKEPETDEPDEKSKLLNFMI